MRSGLNLVAISALGLSIFGIACGDDGTGGSGATGGENTGASGGSGATGGVETGGTGGTGGAGGGEPMLKANGEQCATAAECDSGFCLAEGESGFASGVCTDACNELVACAEGSTCVGVPLKDGTLDLCVKDCTMPNECTAEGSTCVPISDTDAVCIGGCAANDTCASGTTCENDSNFGLGLCLAVTEEICNNQMDEDEDARQDCEETDCAADATCATAISTACTSAVDISAGGTFTGTTADGSNAFAGICSSIFGSFNVGSGSKEKILKFVAPAAGSLSFNATATAGTFDVHVRSDCDDSLGTLGCFDNTDGEIEIDLAAGDTLFFVLDSSSGATDAAYSAAVTFTPFVCGNGIVEGTEECDDNNTTANDGCSATCTTEFAVLCAAATTIMLGDTTGDTTTGSTGFVPTNMGAVQACGAGGGGGKEKVYTYTPAANGMLSITLDSASDQGFHVRTNCAMSSSEVACVDRSFGGTDEVEMVPVTAAQAITIVVDAYEAGDEGPFTLTLAQP